MKNKILGLLLLITLLFTNPVLADDTALISNQGVSLNGQKINIAAYNINDENYFRLRDIAVALKGTDKEFGVEFDPNSLNVMVYKNALYDILPTDLQVLTADNQLAKPNVHGLYINGNNANIKAYNILDNNYYRLRDLGQHLDFGVAYDYNTNQVLLDTSNPNIQDIPLAPQAYQEPSRGYVPVQIPNLTATSYEQLVDLIELHAMNMDRHFTININIPGFTSYNYEHVLMNIIHPMFLSKNYSNIHLVGNYANTNYLIYWHGNGNAYKIEFTNTYNININERHTLYMQIQNWVRDNIDPNMPDETKVRLIHDYIVTNNEYNGALHNGSGVNVQSPYSMLFGGGVCEAYAAYFALMAEEAGLETRFVMGSTYGELSTSGMNYYQAVETLYTRDYEHIWNQVKVDGVWYNIDVTWDDPLNSDHHYAYYLVADQALIGSHVWDTNKAIPVHQDYYPRP